MYVATRLSFTNGLVHSSEEHRRKVGNLGPVASAEGRVEIEIRDLDQTVIGNPAHDLIRLALSLATAARGSDLPGVSTALMMEEMIIGYEGALVDPKGVSHRLRRHSQQHLDPEYVSNQEPCLYSLKIEMALWGNNLRVGWVWPSRWR